MGKNQSNPHVVNFYVDDALKDRLDEESRSLGIGIGQFMRMILRKELKIDAEQSAG